MHLRMFAGMEHGQELESLGVLAGGIAHDRRCPARLDDARDQGRGGVPSHEEPVPGSAHRADERVQRQQTAARFSGRDVDAFIQKPPLPSALVRALPAAVCSRETGQVA